MAVAVEAIGWRWRRRRVTNPKSIRLLLAMSVYVFGDGQWMNEPVPVKCRHRRWRWFDGARISEPPFSKVDGRRINGWKKEGRGRSFGTRRGASRAPMSTYVWGEARILLFSLDFLSCH
jgi:hypothetical protein